MHVTGTSSVYSVTRLLIYSGIFGVEAIKQWRAHKPLLERNAQCHQKQVCIKKYLDIPPIQNGLEQSEALSPLLFNFVFEYVARKIQENPKNLTFSETHQFVVYAADVNLLRGGGGTLTEYQFLWNWAYFLLC